MFTAPRSLPLPTITTLRWCVCKPRSGVRVRDDDAMLRGGGVQLL